MLVIFLLSWQAVKKTTTHSQNRMPLTSKTQQPAKREKVISPLIDQAYRSQQEHILVRVLRGGKTYYVIILDASMKIYW